MTERKKSKAPQTPDNPEKGRTMGDAVLTAHADLKASETPKMHLGDVLNLEFGTRITKRKNIGTQYPVYGGGGESFRTDEYNREDDYVISRFAMSENCVRFVRGKFFLLDSGFTFSIKEEFSDKLLKEFVGYFLMGIQRQILTSARGMGQKNMDVPVFKSFRIPVPPLSEQRIIARMLKAKMKIAAKLNAAAQAQLDAVEALPGAWLRRAFSE